MPKPSSKVHCSGASVMRLRVQQGMTQEKLAGSNYSGGRATPSN
jgi:hypothetical protein